METTNVPRSEVWIGDITCLKCSEKTNLSIPKTQLEMVDGKVFLPSFITIQAFCSHGHTLAGALPLRGNVHNTYSEWRYINRLESSEMYINTMNASPSQHHLVHHGYDRDATYPHKGLVLVDERYLKDSARQRLSETTKVLTVHARTGTGEATSLIVVPAQFRTDILIQLRTTSNEQVPTCPDFNELLNFDPDTTEWNDPRRG